MNDTANPFQAFLVLKLRLYSNNFSASKLPNGEKLKPKKALILRKSKTFKSKQGENNINSSV